MLSQERKQTGEKYKKLAKLIGDKIVAARLEKNMNQTQLANAVQMSVSFLCEIEHGNAMPSIIVYSEICKILDILPEIPET